MAKKKKAKARSGFQQETALAIVEVLAMQSGVINPKQALQVIEDALARYSAQRRRGFKRPG